MFPLLFRIGPFTLHTYGVLLAVAFSLALWYSLREARKEQLNTDSMTNLFLIVVLSAIIGSRLLFVLFSYRYFLEHPLDAFRIWEGGLVFHGGLLLAIAASVVYLRRSGLPLWKTADIAGPAVALGQAVGRLGCLAAGCCYGEATSLPWGITFSHPETLAPRDIPLHPTQLYASLSGWIVFLVLHLFRKKSHVPGQVFWLYLLLASSARFIEDFYRGSSTRLSFFPALTSVQGLCLLIAPAALLLMILFHRRGGSPAPGE
jgi:phosphatidylglycerol:prolipoprotein diacylglycerol transferase